MAKKAQLRITREGTVINTTSKKQEAAVMRALRKVKKRLYTEYNVQLHWRRQWFLYDIVADLRTNFADVDFTYFFKTSSLRPDGGILTMVDAADKHHVILITEKKNQGTNDARLLEGLRKQAKGNAIERLGKNVIGLKTALLAEGIFPFVCFGDGCDFARNSSILGRVVTIAMFGKLNNIYLHPQGANRDFAW
jgi:type II restriction enzyme